MLKPKIKICILGRGSEPGEPKRDSWMLELPTAKKEKDFGLGPRQFNRTNNPKTKQDRSWTETPEQKAKRAAAAAAGQPFIEDETEADPTDDADVLAYMVSLKRDSEMEQVSKELKKKRGDETLMETHAKKLKKKEEEDVKPKERRPFDRDVDLKANQFDEAQKSTMLKKAAKLDNRFSKGQSKFL